MIHLLCIQDSERRCRKRREAALGSNSAASTREMTRWRERERESVRPGTNVFAFHNKLRTPGQQPGPTEFDGRMVSICCLLVSIRAMRHQLCLFIAKRSVRSHLGYEFTLPNMLRVFREKNSSIDRQVLHLSFGCSFQLFLFNVYCRSVQCPLETIRRSIRFNF